MAVAIEDAGFQIRDQIMWLYGSGFPKSVNVGKIVDKQLRGVGQGRSDPKSPMHGTKREKIEGANAKHDITPLYRTENIEYEFEHDISKKWEGWGTALKPAHEPVVMARKPLAEKTVAENVLKHGTGGINIDECRISTEEELGREQKEGPMPPKYGFNDNSMGDKFQEGNSQGRFPAM